MVSTRTGLANSRSEIERFKTVSESSMVAQACNTGSEESRQVDDKLEASPGYKNKRGCLQN